MTYYGRRPRIPKSLLNEHREGLVIGSACEAGELYKAILEERPAETIAELADFMIIMRSSRSVITGL